MQQIWRNREKAARIYCRTIKLWTCFFIMLLIAINLHGIAAASEYPSYFTDRIEGLTFSDLEELDENYHPYTAGVVVMDASVHTDELFADMVNSFKGLTARIIAMHGSGTRSTELAYLYCFPHKIWLVETDTAYGGLNVRELDPPVEFTSSSYVQTVINYAYSICEQYRVVDTETAWKYAVSMYYEITGQEAPSNENSESHRLANEYMAAMAFEKTSIPPETEQWPVKIDVAVDIPKDVTVEEATFWLNHQTTFPAHVDYDHSQITGTFEAWEPGMYIVRLEAYLNGAAVTKEITLDASEITVVPPAQQCTVHSWGEYLYDNDNRSVFYVCDVCKQMETVSSKKADDYIAYLELQDSLGDGNGAYWKILAKNANAYLSSGNGVLGEFMDAASRGGAYLYETLIERATQYSDEIRYIGDEILYGMDERSKIQVDVWMNIIVNSQSELGEGKDDIGTVSDIWDLISAFGDPALDNLVNDVIRFNNNNQAVVDELDRALQTYIWGHDQSQNALNAAANANLQMEAAQSNLITAQNQLQIVKGAQKISKSLPYVFAALNGIVQGSENAAMVSNLQTAYVSMVNECEHNAYRLLCIIEDAKTIQNTELEYAAKILLHELLLKKNAKDEETASVIAKILNGADDTLQTGVGFSLGLVNETIESLAGVGTSMIGQTSNSVSPLGLIQLSAGIVNSFTNADEVAKQSEILSILIEMSSSLEQVNQLKYDGGLNGENYTATIWAKLQQLGDEEASKLADMLTEEHWYDFLSPGGSTLRDFGINTDKSVVKDLLMNENELYQQYLENLASE